MKKTTVSKTSLGLRKERVRRLTPDMLANQVKGGLMMSCCPGTEKCGPMTKPPE